MRKSYIAVIALSLIPCLVFAEEHCTDRPECWQGGGAMHEGLILAEQRRVIESNLRKKHDELVKLVRASIDGMGVDQSLPKTLQAQQVAWLKYRDEECQLIGTLTGAGGSWPSTYARRCELNHTQQRLRRVQSATRCINRIPASDRWDSQNDCLQQLAPLTNKL